MSRTIYKGTGAHAYVYKEREENREMSVAKDMMMQEQDLTILKTPQCRLDEKPIGSDMEGMIEQFKVDRIRMRFAPKFNRKGVQLEGPAFQFFMDGLTFDTYVHERGKNVIKRQGLAFVEDWEDVLRRAENPETKMDALMTWIYRNSFLTEEYFEMAKANPYMWFTIGVNWPLLVKKVGLKGFSDPKYQGSSYEMGKLINSLK